MVDHDGVGRARRDDHQDTEELLECTLSLPAQWVVDISRMAAEKGVPVSLFLRELVRTGLMFQRRTEINRQLDKKRGVDG